MQASIGFVTLLLFFIINIPTHTLGVNLVLLLIKI